jgi:glycine oxidase
MSDVLVAGAGVAGLSVAWRAAQRGLSVTVVDEAPGTGASYAAAGMLAPVAEATYGEEALVALSRASLELYPAFVAELEDASGTTVGSARPAPCSSASTRTTPGRSSRRTPSTSSSASTRPA